MQTSVERPRALGGRLVSMTAARSANKSLQAFGQLVWGFVLLVGAAAEVSAKPDDGYGPAGGCDETESQSGDGGKKFSDPINISTLDYQLAQTDLFIPGRGIDIEFTRVYRSRSGLNSLFLFGEPFWARRLAHPSRNHPADGDELGAQL